MYMFRGADFYLKDKSFRGPSSFKELVSRGKIRGKFLDIAESVIVHCFLSEFLKDSLTKILNWDSL